MVVFMSLIIPLPFNIKRGLFTFISESPIIAKLQSGLKVRKKNNVTIAAWYTDTDTDHVHLHPDPVHR